MLGTLIPAWKTHIQQLVIQPDFIYCHVCCLVLLTQEDRDGFQWNKEETGGSIAEEALSHQSTLQA